MAGKCMLTIMAASWAGYVEECLESNKGFELKKEKAAASQVEQLIFDHLRTAATPKKACEIACACSVTKQEANKVLYKLRKEGRVEKQSDDSKWVVRADTEVECHQKTAELKIEDMALVPPHQPVNAVTPVKDDHKLSENQEKIYQFLSENGSRSALAIAKHMGKKTRKEVNADLYALQKKHVLSQEEDTKLWSVYGRGAGYKLTHPGANKETVPVIIQNNPTNIIYQGGVQNTISIADSRATQIGNYNSLNLVDKKDDSRPTVPHLRAASENADMLHCEAEAKATPQVGQEIDVTESTLKNTVIGNDNQMNITMKDFADSREEHLDRYDTPEKDPFGDIPSASPGQSLKIVNTSLPGERRAPLQRVSIDKSDMENVMIGNNNQMSVHEQCGSAGLADEETNEEDDASDSNLISEQSEWTACDDSSLDRSSDISILCEKLQDVIIGNNNYMNVEEIADTESGEGD
ncbi:E3 ubiquitin-protein ligase RNF123 [Platysternon megacephalum]|uniref:E3 ubiquitin-protein ligase RNF123 n=1 Tax=Platysternon megacephalum TaxID=55544 RepID=A0A4D9E5Y8_9SAUR|nr:E3 ubiquitin-protein ligase RNF123 [Platysternon megacephalum]